MQDLLPILIIVLIAVLIGAVFLIYKKLSELNNPKESTDLVLMNELNNISRELDQKLAQTNEIVQRQLNLSSQQMQTQSLNNNQILQQLNENNTKILQELTEKLVKVEDTNKQVVTFAEQLQNLQSIFKNPKQRGIIGEYFLETILSNVLPESVYQIQYKYKNGDICDAIIFVKDKIVPIDAKFSTDSYGRILEAVDIDHKSKREKEFVNDVKKRIDETSKYVSEVENTIDIAFMFVPSDAIYNEIIAISGNKSIPVNIITYAYSKKVVIVSPTSFFAYLQTVLLALNTIKIEGRIDEIIQYINQSTRYLQEFEESINKLGRNIGTVVNSFNNTATVGTKLSKRLAKVTNNKKNLIAVEKLEKEQDVDEI